MSAPALEVDANAPRHSERREGGWGRRHRDSHGPVIRRSAIPNEACLVRPLATFVASLPAARPLVTTGQGECVRTSRPEAARADGSSLTDAIRAFNFCRGRLDDWIDTISRAHALGRNSPSAPAG